MFTLNIPQRRDPIARLTLLACAALVVAALWFDTSAAVQPAQLPDLFDPIGQLQYAVIILSLIVAVIASRFRHLPKQAVLSPVPFVRVPLKNAERFAILKRDNYRCQICGATSAQGVALQVDHKLAVTNGGANEPRNLWTLCDRCNNGKSDSFL